MLHRAVAGVAPPAIPLPTASSHTPPVPAPMLPPARAAAARLITPFDLSPLVVVPTFGFGRLLKFVRPAWWVWGFRAGHFLLLRRRSRACLPRRSPCVVYAQDPLSARAALDLRREGRDVRVVLAVHYNGSQADEWVDSGLIAPGGRLYRQIARLEQEVLPAVDHLVVPSDFMRREVLARVPAAAAVPMSHLPNFADDPADDPSADAASGAEPAGDLITLGALEPRKNHAFVLRVLAECHRMGHPYRLAVVGDGPLRGPLRALAERLGVAASVDFRGYVPGAARLLPRYRAYVHGATIENLPIALLEALAAGRPLFAPPVGGIPEVFCDGVEGRYWPLDDPREAARRLTEVLESPPAYAACARAARARYEARFTAERVVPAVLETLLPERLYEELPEELPEDGRAPAGAPATADREQHFIAPPARWPRPQLGELWTSRDLLFFFVLRDLKVRYAQTVLGAGWAVLQPVTAMAIFTIVFGRFARVPSDGMPYAAFALTALVPWTFFAAALTGASNSLVLNTHLLTKIYCPRLTIPVSPVLAALVDFAVAFTVLLGVLAAYGIVPSPWTVAVLPLLLLITVMTAAGVGSLLAALHVQYRDVRHVTPFLLQIWMYASPVVYSTTLVPARYRIPYALNPMAGVIEAMRAVLLGTGPMPWTALGIGLASSALMLVGGVLYFRHVERVFADVA